MSQSYTKFAIINPRVTVRAKVDKLMDCFKIE